MKMSEEETKGKSEDVIKHNQAEIMAENFQLKAALDVRDAKIKELAADLKAATEQLENQTRGKKIDRILQVSDLGAGYWLRRACQNLTRSRSFTSMLRPPDSSQLVTAASMQANTTRHCINSTTCSNSIRSEG